MNPKAPEITIVWYRQGEEGQAGVSAAVVRDRVQGMRSEVQRAQDSRRKEKEGVADTVTVVNALKPRVFRGGHDFSYP